MRYAKKDAEQAFRYFVALNNERIAEHAQDTGGLILDYVPQYGGFIIEQVSHDGGGVHHPYKSERLSAKEFYHYVHSYSQGFYAANPELFQERMASYFA